jgi:poly(3-hydroxybutyrate) depolymerase
MMVHAILCQSKTIPDTVDAAVDMLGGIGADYARGPKCAKHKPVPFLKLHGIEDPFITYSKDILVDGVNFASSIEGTQLHAKANGCGTNAVGTKDVLEADGKMVCTDYCGGAPGKLPAKLCGMPGVGHDTDHPHPGFVYEQSWAWFQEQVKAAPGRKPLARKAPKTTDTAERLVLSITYPGQYQGLHLRLGRCRCWCCGCWCSSCCLARGQGRM